MKYKEQVPACIFTSIIQLAFLFILTTNAEEAFLSITLYDHQNRQGPNTTIDVKGCTNLPDDWNDRTSSLSLHGKCIKLYKDTDCTGRVVSILSTPDNKEWLGNLKKLSMNDVISSVSSCRRESPKCKSDFRFKFHCVSRRGFNKPYKKLL